MPTSSWKAFAPPDPEREYLALLTYLPLKRFRTIPRFLGYTKGIVVQLKTSRGVLGYSLRARPLRREFWTLSVWEDEEALREFAFRGFHRGVMIVLREDMAPTRFVRWKVKGTEIPPSWDEALAR